MFVRSVAMTVQSSFTMKMEYPNLNNNYANSLVMQFQYGASVTAGARANVQFINNRFGPHGCRVLSTYAYACTSNPYLWLYPLPASGDNLAVTFTVPPTASLSFSPGPMLWYVAADIGPSLSVGNGTTVYFMDEYYEYKGEQPTGTSAILRGQSLFVDALGSLNFGFDTVHIAAQNISLGPGGYLEIVPNCGSCGATATFSSPVPPTFYLAAGSTLQFGYGFAFFPRGPSSIGTVVFTRPPHFSGPGKIEISNGNVVFPAGTNFGPVPISASACFGVFSYHSLL